MGSPSVPLRWYRMRCPRQVQKPSKTPGYTSLSVALSAEPLIPLATEAMADDARWVQVLGCGALAEETEPSPMLLVCIWGRGMQAWLNVSAWRWMGVCGRAM